MRRMWWTGLLAMAMVWTLVGSASADTLQLTDPYGGTPTLWTLDVQTSCTTCTVTLTADFSDPSAYDGSLIDAVQWVITGESPTGVTLDSFTVNGGAQSGWDTTPAIDSNLSANQCGGGATGAVCDQTTSALGYPVASGDLMVWTFTAVFGSTLPDDLTSGNIRAAFNKPGGKNLNIFSPDGGNFTTTTEGGGPTDIVPEPGLLLLFGSGLTLAATRLRRRRNSSASES